MPYWPKAAGPGLPRSRRSTRRECRDSTFRSGTGSGSPKAQRRTALSGSMLRWSKAWPTPSCSNASPTSARTFPRVTDKRRKRCSLITRPRSRNGGRSSRPRTSSPSENATSLRRGTACDRFDHHALAALTPAAVAVLEHTGAWCSTVSARTIRGQMPSAELVPVASDQQRLAAVAIGALAFRVANVAGADVTQTGLDADAARHAQRRWRRRRLVAHLPVGMKGGEVQRHVGPQVLDNPAAERFHFGRLVVLSRDEQRRDLEPDLGF